MTDKSSNTLTRDFVQDTTPDFAKQLLAWFDQHGRKDLPWQQNKTPYRVWVSEIMLQQTQVQSVIDYYLRFMNTFPDLESLANAPIDQVLEHWSGLGYYARARNLHKAAIIVNEEYGGAFPDNSDELVALPGIGRSTAAAILSIAFKQPATILDGNVKRVLCRFDHVETWSGLKNTENVLWRRAEQLTPQERNADYTQAIMDLGATCCTRSKPNCDNCPVQSDCLSFRHSAQSKIPVSKPKKEKPTKHRWLLKIKQGDKTLLEKRPPSGIWGGLYSLPEHDFENTIQQALTATANHLNLKFENPVQLESFKHVFSHYTVVMHPIEVTAIQSHSLQLNEINSHEWLTELDLQTVGLPAPIKKFLSQSCSQAELGLE